MAKSLSPDAARYAGLVASGTGLDPTVVTAWVAAESGWDITKPSHNYLNVGPGRTYPSTDQGATAAAALVNTSSNYAGIRASKTAGGWAQVQAIGGSKWGTKLASLGTIYQQLAGPGGPGLVAVDPDGYTLKERIGIVDPLSPSEMLDVTANVATGLVTGVADVAKNAMLDGVAKIVDAFAAQLLGLVFTAAALALIAVGLNRLTGTPAKERFGQVSKLVGGASMAAAAL